MSKTSLVNKCKKDILSIYRSAIEGVRPDRLVNDALKLRENILVVKNRFSTNSDIELDLKRSNIHVIGGGKSVLAMACELARFADRSGISQLFLDGCLSLPIGLRPNYESNSQTQCLLSSIRVECLFGGENNLPDEHSVRASKVIFDYISKACDNAFKENKIPLFVVLIGGGGSACLTYPKYIDLESKLKIISHLVKRGADIVELNKVRRYFSSIKGGQLAFHILKSHPEAKILSLILSDVVGDPVEYIASGPTFVGNSTRPVEFRQTMLEILRKYDYNSPELEFALPQKEDEHPARLADRVIINQIIGNNTIALIAAENEARALGYKVETIGNGLQGFSYQVLESIINTGDDVFSKSRENILVIGGGEATIHKSDDETWGVGGRVQEMALDYLIHKLGQRGETSTDSASIDVLLAGSTDGQDGPTDVAACLVSHGELLDRGSTMLLEAAIRAKRTHNSYDFWSKYKPEWLIKTGLTGTNFMDLYMYLKVDCK